MFQTVPQLLSVLDQDLAVNLEEHADKRLDGLKVSMRLEPLGQRVDEEIEVLERRPQGRSDLEVGRGRGERLEVQEERFDWKE